MPASHNGSRPLQPFEFGIQCSTPPEVTAAGWRDLTRRIEDLGYHRLTVSDHLDDQLGPIAALMAAAAATSTIRVGALVFSNDHRHPAVLAKEAATLDVLSDGRFELGLGAGWMASDYDPVGIEMDRAGVRIDRLEESVRIIRGLLSGEPVHHDGDHYRISGLVGTPRPVQDPLPILIGGGGPRVLALAARHADIVGLNPVLRHGLVDPAAGASATAEATERKIGWIREAAGDRFDDITLHTRIHLAVVTNDRVGVAEQLAAGFGLTLEEALGTPHALCGTVEQIAEDLLERRERFGISSIGLGLESLDAMAPVVELLAGR